MQQVAWHALATAEVLERLGVERMGLSGTEAGRRLAEVGPNELRRERGVSPLVVFLHQFREFLVLLLLGATVVSLLLGELLDAAVIFAIVILSAFLGFLQEYRASRALSALRQLSAPTADVVRDGEEMQIPAREIVPGDILVLAAGDRVPADARVIEQYNLRVDETAFTGESEPVAKQEEALPADMSLAERTNLVFAGTTAIYGRGMAAVVATGMETEFGRIAHLVQTVDGAKEETPLERRMEEIGRSLGVAGMVAVLVVVALGLLRGEPLLAMFFWGVSLAVAVVPEALPAVVTGALTIGVQRMARRNAIMRKLPAVETLGATTIICSDKTGTLTMNQMTVEQMLVGGRRVAVSGSGYEPVGALLRDGQPVAANADVGLLMRAAVLCNDAHLVRGPEGRHSILGDPTEAALVVAAVKAGWEPEPLRLTYPRVAEITFSSVRKRMTTIHRTPEGRSLVCTKGAPEVVLPLCRHHLVGAAVRPLDGDARQEILAANEAMAGDALRVLAVAYRLVSRPEVEAAEHVAERDLIFAGLMGMVDPPREEAKAALRRAEQAGVRTVMITGDHKLTALAVAGELGLLREGDRTLTGAELERLSEAEFDALAPQVAVYARVSPEDKLHIVEALQKQAQVVVMTGDGVNDAPALRRADIGVAMGIAGTDVAKEAADMVLADDNFATIVAAMEEGRAIYDNVKKYLAYLLSSNVGELLIMFVTGLVGLPLPLLAVQILWVNLVTDGLPAIALGVDPPDPDVMRRPPRPPRESVFTPGVLMLIGVVGALASAGVLLAFVWKLRLGAGLAEAQTMAFTTLVMFEMFNAFNARSEKHSIFKVGPFRNRWLILAVVCSVLLQVAVIYSPLLQPIFGATPLGLVDWVAIVLMGSTAVIGGEIGKRVLAGRGLR